VLTVRFLLSLACFVLFISTASRADVPFTLDAVGSPNASYDTYPSFTLDPNDSPRLAFNGKVDSMNLLYYAEKTSGAWTIELADPTTVGWDPALALDSVGEPRISYVANTNGNFDLVLATRSLGYWTRETVDSIWQTGTHSSVVLDSQDVPHISYHTAFESNGFLKYATKSDGVWVTEIADAFGSGNSTGLYTSLKLDAFGNPCIAYYSRTHGQAKFARKAEGVWTKEIVGSGGEFGGYTSLAIDAEGNYHVSFTSRFPDQVVYAVKSGGAWTTEIVDDVIATQASIDVDALGNPWISYRYSGVLLLATKQGGTWTTQIVDPNSQTGQSSTVVLDSKNLPWIGYFSQYSYDVLVAIPNSAALGVESFPSGDLFVGAPFPNPSRGTVSLAIRVPSLDSIRLTLFDVGGRMISRIPAQEQGGSRIVTWNPQDVESGVYFLRVESSSGIQETRQLTIIR
jgi:hypothetical protein